MSTTNDVRTEDQDTPPLATLVMAGGQQTEADVINDFIYMARDISNAYLITTADGDVMVNTGFSSNADRTKQLLDPHRTGALKFIIITQSHGDHYGGVPEFREPETKIITERRFTETRRYYTVLEPFFQPRTGKLWGTTVRQDESFKYPQEVEPDITVDRSYEFELGGRTFQLLSTPGGETIDSLTVWMPQERIAFTGNLLGPVFMSMPFLSTIRGDKPRSVLRYLRSLDRLRALEPDLLITGHGDPIRGRDKIKADLDKLYAAVSYVNDETIAGMNAGKDVHTLMREIALPEDLKIGEFHGNVRWAVRAIWDEYSAWFHYDSTTSLYGVPRSSVDADIVELAGGVDRIAQRAQEKVDAQQPLEAIHLLDIALRVEPANTAALNAHKAALEQLLAASGGANLSETMWLRSEIAAATAALEK